MMGANTTLSIAAHKLKPIVTQKKPAESRLLSS